jgi:hypothetical protein
MTALTIEGVMTSIVALTTALNRVADNQDRLIAGQAAAIAAAEGGKTSTRTPRASKKEETPAPAAGQKVEEVVEPRTVEEVVAAAPEMANVDALKEYVTKWTGAATDDADKAARVGLLKGIAGKFGVKPAFSELFPHAVQAVFLIERAKKLGISAVDLKADYDFSGDPAQDVGGPAATSDDEFG